MPNNQYSAKDIVILEGLDAVRKRPGMYIGSTDSRGLHHLIWEIVDNAVDEAINGFGQEISITLHQDGSVEVEDHGRGMPVGQHASGVSALQVIFTVLHAGGKFTSSGGYHHAGGLHGVGASVVNALSEWCVVTVHDGKQKWQMRFENGDKVIGPLENLGKTNRTGSIVRFKPAYQLFKDKRFSFSKICERAQEDAYLLNGLTMKVVDLRKEEPVEQVFCYEQGLKAFIADINANRKAMHEAVSFSGEVNGIKVEACFQYTDDYQENVFSFVNMVRTMDGGTHETGAKSAMTKVINEYARQYHFLKDKDKSLEGSDVREGLSLVLVLTIPEQFLQFEGQTKAKLGSPEAKPACESVVGENLRYFLEENKAVADALVNKMIKAAQARLEARKAREAARSKNKKRSESVLSGKLCSAQSKDARKKELYLVEGDSAGGSAKQGRDAKYQAILPLRGKVLNTAKAKESQIHANEELNTIFHALGAGLGLEFSAKDANYHKVIIMTDADDDGAHIQNLLLTFFYQHMKGLIDEKMLYIAMPPLYRLANKDEERYLYTDDQLQQARQEMNKPYTLTRYKGLGEMNADQLWTTTMNPETRTLICVTVDNAIMAQKRVNELMGDDASARRRWIEENVEFSLEDDYGQSNTD